MKEDTPRRAVDLQARAVDQAIRGELPGIRVILRDAIELISNGRPIIHEGRARFLADALEKAMIPGQEIFAEAAKYLRRRDPLPSEIGSPVLEGCVPMSVEFAKSAAEPPAVE